MAAGFNVEQLRSLLECAICLQQYDNPKMLKCQHEFCKECLEDIITFQQDGSAVIVCPLRCEEQTIISENQTVNNLAASYNLKNILDALNMKDKQLESEIPICHCETNCKKYVSVYCCGHMMCNRCFVNHRKTVGNGLHQRTVNLSFNKREKKLNVLCDEHFANCIYFIDNKFLCSYCIHRNQYHAKHTKSTVEREVELLKDVLDNVLSEKEKVLQFQKTTEQSIMISKKNFEDLLQQRREECLSHYNDFLNKKEELLKKEFQSICDNRMQNYCIGLSSEYYEEMLRRSDVELLIEKEEILHTICKNKNKSTLNYETVSLSDTFDFLSEHPLGDIDVTVDENESNAPVPTLTHTIKYTIESENNKNKQIQSSGSNNSLFKHTQSSYSNRKLATDVFINSKSSACSQGDSAQVVGATSNISIQTQPSLEQFQHNAGQNEIIKNLTNKNVQAFFDIEIGNTPAGRMVMNLCHDVAPKMCEHFLRLCTHERGFGYKCSKLYYVDSYYGCRGGDITKSDGSGWKCEKFPCENFIKKHDDKGILSMKNIGGFTSCEFYITTKAQPWWNGRRVVFGKVTDETYHVIEKIMAVEELPGWMPLEDIVIVDSGILNST